MKKKLFVASIALAAALAACQKPDGNDSDGTSNGQDSKQALVKSVEIKDRDIAYVYEFGYDSGNRAVSIVRGCPGSESDDIPVEISYGEGTVSVVMNMSDSGEKCTYTADLDESGRVCRLEENTPYYSDVYSVEYDKDGFISRMSSDGNTGSLDSGLDFVWADGNLSVIFAGGTDLPESDSDFINFYYSEYDNSCNIDINWLITFGRGYLMDNGMEWLGTIGLTGSRDSRYAIPGYEFNTFPSTAPFAEGIVEESRLGEVVTVENYTPSEVCIYENSICDYKFNGNGTLSSITADIPVHRITYNCTGILTPVDPDMYEEYDGVKYYHVYVDVTEAEVVSDEQTGYDNLTVSVTYF